MTVYAYFGLVQLLNGYLGTESAITIVPEWSPNGPSVTSQLLAELVKSNHYEISEGLWIIALNF